MALIETLPIMPTAIHVPARIMQLYRSPSSPSLNHFAEVLIADASLCTKVLELANSAYYCPTKTVTKISDALRMIGLSNLLPLLFGLSLAGLFNKADLPPDERAALWQTSLLKAILAREWAKWRGIDQQEEAFLLGVLQDIALPAMFAGDRSAGPELSGVIDLPETDRAHREVALFATDHATLGGALCKRMNLPEVYADAVATHHAPEGPQLPPEYAGLTGGLRLAAAVPHRMLRLDENAAKKLAETFMRVAPEATPKDFAAFVLRATTSAKLLMSALAPADSKNGMKMFLQDVSDQIARTMISAIGTSNQTIEQLQSSHLELEKRIRDLYQQVVRADYDPLTNVMSRTGLLNRAEKIFGLARTFEMGCAVGFLDLDQFKALNEHYGPQVGDRALMAVANALSGMMQNRGMVGRCGGDEFAFVMVLPLDYDHDRIAGEVAAKLASLNILAGAEKIELQSTIGICWLGQPAESVNIYDAIKEAEHHAACPVAPSGQAQPKAA